MPRGGRQLALSWVGRIETSLMLAPVKWRLSGRLWTSICTSAPLAPVNAWPAARASLSGRCDHPVSDKGCLPGGRRGLTGGVQPSSSTPHDRRYWAGGGSPRSTKVDHGYQSRRRCPGRSGDKPCSEDERRSDAGAEQGPCARGVVHPGFARGTAAAAATTGDSGYCRHAATRDRLREKPPGRVSGGRPGRLRENGSGGPALGAMTLSSRQHLPEFGEVGRHLGHFEALAELPFDLGARDDAAHAFRSL